MRERSSLVLTCLLFSLGCVYAGQRPPAPQQLLEPPPEPAINCIGHADGLYVRDPTACNDGFYKCANSRSFYYRCPTGLFFSIEDAQCEYKQLIPACGGQRPIEQNNNMQMQTAPVAVAQSYGQPLPQQAPIAPSVQQYSVPQQAPIAPSVQQYSAPQQAPIAPSVQQYSAPQEVPIAASLPQQQYSARQQAPIAPSVQQYSAPQPIQVSQPASIPSYQISLQQSSSENAYQGALNMPTQKRRRKLKAVPKLVATTTRRPVNFNCGNNPDGFYAKRPCVDTVYYSCVGGIATELNCPPNTVFDPAAKACDFANECGKPKTTTAIPLVNYGKGWQLPTTKAPSTECIGRQDGFYARGHCVKDYLHCSHGHAFDLKCPSGLVFRNESCTYLGDCLNPTTPAPVLLVQTSPTPPPLTWCRDNHKETGFYPQGTCSQKFYSCNGGFTAELSCAASTVYDKTTQQCESRQFVIECGGRPTPPTTTTPASMRRTTRRPNYNCQGKSDGYHTTGCSANYYVCSGGEALNELRCQPGLAFDMTTEQCNEAQYVPACGGYPTTSTKPTPTTTTRRPNYNCQGLSDGYHTVGCTASYFFCLGGQPMNELRCQSGLAFDISTQQCNEARYVPACGGHPTTTTPPAPVAPAKPIDFDCSTKTNGYYHKPGCVSTYYYCNGGTGIELHCPTGLFFSSAVKSCDYRGNTPECGGKLPTTTQTPMEYEYVYEDEEESAPILAQQPQAYAAPTQAPTPIAVQSQYGQAQHEQAPQSPTLAEQPQSPSHQPSQMSGSHMSSPQMTAPQMTAPQLTQVAPAQPDNSNQCAHLQNGIYGLKCSRQYVVCTNHKAFDFTCPNGFAYDRTIARCGPVDKIQGCSST